MPKIVAQKEDWIKLGYQLFAEAGIKGIVVEKMAKNLACNKSSFYWHFKTKKEFIDEVIDFWVKTETNQIIDDVEVQSTPQKKWNKFLEIAFQLDPYLEFIFFLKRYAIERTDIQALIDDIDSKRLAFVANLLQELGYPKKSATIQASIFYKYLIGYHEMHRYKKQPKNYVKLVKQELKLLINI